MDGIAFAAVAAVGVAAQMLRARGAAKRAALTAAAAAPRAVVDELAVFPIKSTKAHKLKRWAVDAYGLVHDRRWMIVTSKGDFVTQRTNGNLALLVAEVYCGAPDSPLNLVNHPAAAGFSLPPLAGDVPVLRLIAVADIATAAGLTPAGSFVDVPLRATPAAAAAATSTASVSIWDDTVTGAVDQGDAVGAWLSATLGTDGLRLVYMPASSAEGTALRKLSAKWVPFAVDPATAAAAAAATTTTGSGTGSGAVLNQVSFADAYNLLCLSRESVAELQRRIAAAAASGAGSAASDGAPSAAAAAASITADNFRANLIVRSLTSDEAAACGGVAGAVTPNQEDSWLAFSVAPPAATAAGGASSAASATGTAAPIDFRGVKRCDRCTVTTIDPATGVKGGVKAEPLVTMRTYRSSSSSAGSGAVFMGMNLVVVQPAGGSPAAAYGGGDAAACAGLRWIAAGDVIRVAQEGPCGPF